MMGYVRPAPPTTSVFPGRLLWATLRAIDDDDLGAAVRAEVAEAIARVGMAVFRWAGRRSRPSSSVGGGDAGPR